MSTEVKKIVFITETRAEFGKLKPLINKLEKSKQFEVYIFVTGMHMLQKYGATIIEVINEGYKNVYPFNNHIELSDMDNTLAKTTWFSSYHTHKVMSKTIEGFSDYIQIIKPDMIVIHGDRVAILAAAIVGALSNILVAHIEGGEVSGTIDELIRHAVTKMSHIHFVANKKAKGRVVQLGENKENVYVVGSADIDVMLSKKLPSLRATKKKYEIPFKNYSIFVYHPVTTELNKLETNIKTAISALVATGDNYIVTYPNNDPGSDIIIKQIEKLQKSNEFKVFPSIRFEHYLNLLKNADCIIGNSSAGIREAGVYGIPAINIGSRQQKRSKRKGIINVSNKKEEIVTEYLKAKKLKLKPNFEFGDGKCAQRFYRAMSTKKIWGISPQKHFVDI